MNKVNKGFTLVELLVVIGILGILMGVLYPSISGAMQKTNLNNCCFQGKKLWDAIVASNIERESHGLPSVWPKTSDTKIDDNEDIAGQDCSDSMTWFKYLFAIDDYGTKEWKDKKFVDAELSWISGYGVPSFQGQSFTGNNVLWCVAKGVDDNLADVVPVLVSRNCAIDSLFKSGDFKGNETEKVKMGKENGGESDTPFGSAAFVIIRKGGGAEAIQSKYNKQSQVYRNQGFTISSDSGFEYLKTGAN